ncbi:MAG: YraN family protein, partial [Ignavibacteriae bacterium HGW-Ignavibacteriae-3]
MSENRRNTGNYGEDLACEFLLDLGYEIIERNYLYNHGEIDIIAVENDQLVFVEVKYRKNLEYGPPELSISKTKQKVIKRTAEAYLFEREIKDQPCRIDFIAILHLKDEKPVINHFKNAF